MGSLHTEREGLSELIFITNKKLRYHLLLLRSIPPTPHQMGRPPP